MRKRSAYITGGKEPQVEVLLVNHRGVVLSRLPQRFATLGEARAEAARRNAKAAK